MTDMLEKSMKIYSARRLAFTFNQVDMAVDVDDKLMLLNARSLLTGATGKVVAKRGS